MIIKVTQNHIDRGEPGRCFRCPIALAAEDLIPSFMGVTSTGIRVSHREKHEGYVTHPITIVKLPREAADFIHKFDMGEEVKPFEFELKI